jgi:hypothetical protein
MITCNPTILVLLLEHIYRLALVRYEIVLFCVWHVQRVPLALLPAPHPQPLNAHKSKDTLTSGLHKYPMIL